MYKLKRVIIIVYCLLILLVMGVTAKEPEKTIGQVCVNETWLNVRDGAGTEYRIIDALYDGDSVVILDSLKSNMGDMWYKVFFERNGYQRIGYVHSDYVAIGYEQVLLNKGFPESYVDALCKLHEKYPEWEFEAFNTGLTWQEVIKAESVNGKNLVPDYSSTPSSWKSTAEGAFDWEKNKWVVFSGKNSVQASSDVIAYYMDPRNFLTEEGIFQFEKLTYSKNHTVSGVEGILSGTFMSNARLPGEEITYSSACVNIGEKLGISPYFLAGRLRQEQGVKGNSDLISGLRNGFENYYNYFNIGASGTGDSVVVNGLTRAASEGWNSAYKAIEGGAAIISSDYILSGQDTLYLQKFDVESSSWDLFWHQYMQTIAAPSDEAKSVYKAYKTNGILNTKLVFKIPVYEDMPYTPCKLPEGDGNPNCRLSSLKVKGYENAFSFDVNDYSYEMKVSKGVSEIQVIAETIDDKAVIEGDGTVSLYPGMNVVEIKCTAESGANWVYRIYVTRDY